jgi:DNA modification methylase
MKPASSCVVSASNTEMRKLIGHPFAKPYECWNFLTSKVCLPGQTILEPFAGRGSGVLSMLRNQLNVIAVEINVAHYNALLEVVKREFYLKQNPKYVFK